MSPTDSISPLAEAAAHYRKLNSLRDKLQQEKVNIELDLKQSALHPEFYANPKGQAYLAQARNRHPELTQEIDDILKQQRALLLEFPALQWQLERELFGNGQADATNEGSEGAESQAAHEQPDSWPILTEESLPDEARCIFCHLPVDSVKGNWCGHGQMAHNECAWAAEDAFWTAFDAAAEGDKGGK